MNCKRLAALAAALWLTAAPAAAQVEPAAVKLTGERRGFVTEYTLPDPKWQPWSIEASRPDEVWVTLDGAYQIGRLRPSTGEITVYGAPEPVRPFLLSRAPDGAVWFTDFEYVADPPPGRLWRIDPATGKMEKHDLPDPKVGPAMIAFDQAGTPWFTQMLGGKVGRLEQGRVVEMPPVEGGRPDRPLPVGLAFDQQGRLWVAESGADRILMYDMRDKGISRAFQVPEGFWSPTDIKVGPDGLIWTGGHGTNDLGSLDPATGKFTVWPLRRPDGMRSPVSRPNGIAVDAKGQVWAAEHEGNRITRLIPSENLVVEYPLETLGFKEPWPQWVSVDPDGNVWYASWGTSRIGRIDANAPYWKVEADIGSGKVNTGGRLAGRATATPQAGAAGDVTWELAGAPWGVSATFTPQADGTVSFAIDVDREADPGTYQMLVGVRTDTVLASQPVTLVIARPLLGIPGLTWPAVAVGGGIMVAAVLAAIVRQRRRKV